MKRRIRWLKTVKLPAPLGTAIWTGADARRSPQPKGFRTFKEGEETTVDIRNGKILIKLLDALPARLVEGTHFEFIE